MSFLNDAQPQFCFTVANPALSDNKFCFCQCNCGP
jgi:hypothetical protein